MNQRSANPAYEPYELNAPVPGNVVKPRDPSRLEVAVYFDRAAANALDELETWAKMWGQHYDPAVLKAALVALRAVKETVNR